MDPQAYRQAFRASSADIAAVARRDVRAPIPSCPGWAMANLLGHLGAVYTSIARNISFGAGEDIVNELDDLQLAPAYATWFEGGRSAEAAPADVVDWFDAAVARLAQVFDDSDPEMRTWTWFPPEQTVGFWLRRMAHETAIHAWDARGAHGESYAYDSDLAADGVDEALSVYQPMHCRPTSTVEGRGETYHFHRTDGPGEWLVRFDGSEMTVTREHRRADVAFRGAAPDLFLFLWHRIPADRLEVLGDEVAATRYFELAPPD